MKMAVGGIFVIMLLTGCVIDPYTGEKKVAKTGYGAAIGVASGAAIGAIVGGGEGALIGAGVGGAVGAGAGYYMDRQEAALRHQLKGTEIEVQRQGQNIKLIVPNNITFATDSATINGEFYSILEALSSNLKEFGETSINISGYTDSTGGDMYNQELSEHRANAVAGYLVKTGVQHIRIQSRGFGERYPVAPNDSAMGRSQNRRVEISIRPR